MKKILGYLFFVIGGFLSLSILVQIPTIFEDFSNTTSKHMAYSFGVVAGKLIAMCITIAIIILLIWLGRKLTKKTIRPAELHDIGSENIK